MSSFLIRYEGRVYANEELYVNAVAEGERSLVKMLAEGMVKGTFILGQAVYPVTVEQEAACRLFNPEEQNFDRAYRYLNVLSKGAVQEIKDGTSEAFPGAAVVTLSTDAAPKFFKYRRVSFFKIRDFKETRKYKMLEKLASVKVCGRLYVALNSVDARVERPIIVTIKG